MIIPRIVMKVGKCFCIGIEQSQTFAGSDPYISVGIFIDTTHIVPRKAVRVLRIMDEVLHGFVIQGEDAQPAFYVSDV